MPAPETAIELEHVGRRAGRSIARHEVDAGGDHRGGVDERGDGRRAGHRVRQPDVQGELRGLAEETAHQERADGARAEPGRGLELRPELGEVERAELREAEGDAEDEAEVADAVRR